ncbi:hypothetical protein ACHAWO_008267 [Cyclotella atomus]|jgi:hypothetical protein|uniref:Uncharacterized protein n=1 Tax=Cyclotella atomus TaxID=382360 RepID=A0ABD3MRN1_9STRA
MNKQKVMPSESGIAFGQKKARVKRVSFEKERNADDKAIQNIEFIGKSLPLKPSIKPQAQVTESDDSAPQLTVAVHPAPLSQHEEMLSRAPAPAINRRRVKSMPAGSVASRDFFRIVEATPPRNTCLVALEVLHEDRIVVESKLMPRQEASAEKPPTQQETNTSPTYSEQQATSTVYQEQDSCCIIL